MLVYKNRLTRPEKFGYISMKRNRRSTIKEGVRTIVWWKKGYSDCRYIKCDAYSPEGYYAEGTGETLKEAIKELFKWFNILEGKIKYGR